MENFNRKALYLMVKTMVSCRFSLKPWDFTISGGAGSQSQRESQGQGEGSGQGGRWNR